MEKTIKLSSKSNISSIYDESEDILDDIIHDISKRIRHDRNVSKKTVEEMISEISFGDSNQPSQTEKPRQYQKK